MWTLPPVLQVIGTAALLMCVLALGDQRNSPLPDGLQPVLVGAAVLVIGVSMGSNSGYALNPARDLGPRLFTYIAGWGVDVFKLVASVFKPCSLPHVNEFKVWLDVTPLSLQGRRWLVVGAHSGPLCRGAARDADLHADGWSAPPQPVWAPDIMSGGYWEGGGGAGRGGAGLCQAQH